MWVFCQIFDKHFLSVYCLFTFLLVFFLAGRSPVLLLFLLCFVFCAKFFAISPSLEVMLFCSYCVVLAFAVRYMVLFRLFFITLWGKNQGSVSSMQFLPALFIKKENFSSKEFHWYTFKKTYFSWILYSVPFIYVCACISLYTTIILS